MLRTCILICVLFLIAGCEKNWRGIMIEKRVYREGYYVHLPWKRYTPKHEYPKPEPSPVDHPRNAPATARVPQAGGDTSRQAVRSVPSDSTGTSSQPATATAGTAGGNATYTGYGSTPGATPALTVGSPESGDGSVGTGGGSGTSGPPIYSSPPLPATVSSQVSITPAPVLQHEEIYDPILPSRPDSLLPDSSIVVDSTLLDSAIAEEGFQFPEGEFSLIAEAGFYNSASAKSIEVNPFSYNIGFGTRYTIHPWSRHQISAEGSVFVSNISIRQKQYKQSPLFTEAYDHERIMQWKMRFMLVDHIYFTRNASAYLDAIELGIFSDIGFFSTHVAVNNHVENAHSGFTRDKSRRVGLKYLRCVQSGLTVRIANDKWSFFGNYRISAFFRQDFTNENIPKAVIGITRTFSD